jgi:hypothetical protein
MRKLLLLIIFLGAFPLSAQQIFNCTSFAATGACGVSLVFPFNQTFFALGATGPTPPTLNGGSVVLAQPNGSHTAINLNYSLATVNDQAFQSRFTFVPSGWNVSFVLQNNTSTQGGGGPGLNASFSSGAGCEGSIYQAFPAGGMTPDYDPPNNIMALMLDQRSPLTDANGSGQGGGSAPFTFSGARLLGSGQDPCNPRDGTEQFYYFTQGVSTSPVAMNSPVNSINTDAGGSVNTAFSESGGVTTMTGTNNFTAGESVLLSAVSTDALAAYNGQTVTVLSSGLSATSWEFTGSAVTGSGTTAATTGDNFSETVTYQGNNVTIQLFDATAGGSCPGSTCFTKTWTNISVPTLVNGTTAFVGIAESTNEPSGLPLIINTFEYTVFSAAATPSISPSSGTFSSSQSVAITDSSPGSIICFNTTGNPSTNGIGGCQNGTLFTGAFSVTKGQTVFAVAGSGTTLYGDSAVASAAYNITGSAAAPTYSIGSGTYYGNQVVILSAAHGGVICFSTTGTPATNGSTGCTTGTIYTAPVVVSTNETLSAVSGGTGFTDSPVNSASYIISPYWGTFGDSPLPAATPTFSPLPGTYTGTQNVTLTSTTAGANICYDVSSSPIIVGAYPNSAGGCQSGTLYSGPVAVSSSQIIQATAGTNITTYNYCGGSTGCLGSSTPSTATVGKFTINTSSPATAPSCTPTSGSSTSPITVTCSNSNSGTTIMCFTENGTTPVTNGAGTGCTTGSVVSSTISISSTVASLKVVAGTSTLTDSTAFTSGPYTIGTATSANGVSAVGVKIQ